MNRAALLALSLIACGCAPRGMIDIVFQPVDVPTGSEVQDCYYLKAPTSADFTIGHVTMDFVPGTHHVQLYYSDQPHADGVEECFQAVDFDRWHLIASTQKPQLDWQLPDGVALQIKAGQQLLVQVHYVNTGKLVTEGGRGAGTIHLAELPSADVREYMGSVFGQQELIDIKPHASYSVEGLCTTPANVDLAAYAGHYHFRGRDFIGYKTDRAGQQAVEFYRSDNFAEPAFMIYDHDPVHIGAGERLMWHCDYDNDTDVEVPFGPREEDQEHCNMFVFYHPARSPQEFVPCVSYGRCAAQCTDDQTCAEDGTCVAR